MREWSIRILLVLVGTIIGLCLCEVLAEAKGKSLDFDRYDSWSFYDWKMRISDEAEEWVDKDTGVHYLVIFDDSTVRAITPRYDSNGKVMVK